MKIIKCKYCGARELIELEDGKVKCSFCGTTSERETAKGMYEKVLAKLEEQEKKRFETAVKNLSTEVSKPHPSPESVVRYAEEGRSIDPDFIYANLYKFLFANTENAQDSENFFEEIRCREDLTPEVKTGIAECFIKYYKRTYHDGLQKYIKEQIAPPEKDILEAAFCKRIQEEDDGVYDCTIERGVFICHQSKDIEIAKEVVAACEEDGVKCWVSYRNLRNNSNDYWKDIKTAIQNCSLFLVICSDAAMRGSDDVLKEMDFAKQYKKPRLEYKVSAFKKHTKIFHDFFDGISWIDAAEAYSPDMPNTDAKRAEKLEELRKRIWETLEQVEQQEKEEQRVRAEDQAQRAQEKAEIAPKKKKKEKRVRQVIKCRFDRIKDR